MAVAYIIMLDYQLFGFFSLSLRLDTYQSLVSGNLGVSSLGGLTSSSAGSRGLLTLGTDCVPGETGNSTFVLDGATTALLGDFFGDALLVEATVDLGPADLARVQALQEQGLGLAVNEAEGLQ